MAWSRIGVPQKTMVPNKVCPEILASGIAKGIGQSVIQGNK